MAITGYAHGMRRPAPLVIALLVAACSVDSAGPAAPSPASSNAVAPVLEPGAFPPRATPLPVAAPIGKAPPRVALAPVRVRVVRLAVAEGEDGHGHTIRAVHPAAVDLETEGGWHASALATTMTIGDLRFHNMGYPNVTTMRFIVADDEALPRNAEVALELGTPARRRVLAPSLPVP
jgi:hypothetical protein